MKKILFRRGRSGWVWVAILLLSGCAQLPREPLVQLPMTARADSVVRPAAPVNGAIYRTGFGAQALFEDRRPR